MEEMNMEYVIRKYGGRGFCYNPNSDRIEFNHEDNLLTDEELSEYLCDSIIHEYIHKILYDMFNARVSKLFDLVDHYFRNEELHVKYLEKFNSELNSECQKYTYSQWKKMRSIEQILNKWDYTIWELAECKKICDKRIIHNMEE